jgi:glycosyltransferase involved in cell wall biosynthesis
MAAPAGLRVLACCERIPFGSCGGSDHVAWQIHRRLAQRGMETTMVAAVAPGEAPMEEVRDGVRLVGLPAVDLSARLGGQATVLRRLLPTLRWLSEDVRPHVIHANSLHFHSTLAAALLSRTRGIPMVTTAHLGGLDALPRALRLATGGYEQTLGRFILRGSAEVIAVSQSVAAHVGQLGMPADRITVVPNGVDLDAFAPPARPAHQDERAGGLRIVFVGRLVGNKGPDVALSALAELRNRGVPATLEVVGDGPLRRRLQVQAAELGVAGLVTFAGVTTEVAAHLRRADVLVRPSQTEGMPLAVLEAMACGLCVVATDIQGNADLIGNGLNGLLVTPGRPVQLADRLAWLFRHPTERGALAAAGRVTAAGHGWDEAADRTAEVLLRGARQPGRGRARLRSGGPGEVWKKSRSYA